MITTFNLSMSGIESVNPFDDKYVKVFKSGLYNLMDANGQYVSEEWYRDIRHTAVGTIDVVTDKQERREYKNAQTFIKAMDVQKIIRNTKVLSSISIESVRPYASVVEKLVTDCGTTSKKRANIVAEVNYMGESLYLSEDGKLYSADYREFVPAKFNISQTTISEIISNTRDVCEVLNPAVRTSNPWNRNYLRSWGEILNDKIACLVFGFAAEQGSRGKNYSFVSDMAEPFGECEVRPWGKDVIMRIVADNVAENIKSNVFSLCKENGFRPCRIVESGLDKGVIILEKEFSANELGDMYKFMELLINMN